MFIYLFFHKNTNQNKMIYLIYQVRKRIIFVICMYVKPHWFFFQIFRHQWKVCVIVFGNQKVYIDILWIERFSLKIPAAVVEFVAAVAAASPNRSRRLRFNSAVSESFSNGLTIAPNRSARAFFFRCCCHRVLIVSKISMYKIIFLTFNFSGLAASAAWALCNAGLRTPNRAARD